MTHFFEKNKPYNMPDAKGHFEQYGGKYVPETLMGALFELEKVFREAVNDEKFLEEFNIVKEQLLEILSPLAETVTANATGIKEFKKLKHLHAMICAKLKTINDAEILKAFHPTAALLGYPKCAAVGLLKSTETHARSLYGGPIGFLSESLSHILVGIRSGFLEEKTLNAFTGVGIVKTSNSLDEWEELNLKLQPISIWKN